MSTNREKTIETIRQYQAGCWYVTELRAGEKYRVTAEIMESDRSILAGTTGETIVSEWADSVESAYADPIIGFLQ